MKRVVTIKDIAKELNISPGTVSRALKDHPDISASTKRSVVELAEKWDYQPNSIARSLRQSKSNTIGVIVPRIAHYFFANVIAGIEQVANSKGFNIIICQSNELKDREIAALHTLLATRVDAICLSLASGTDDFDHLKAFSKRGTPILFFDRICEEISVPSVIVDDFEGAYQATQYLIQTGCKTIAHLAGPKSLTITKKRMEGYLAALSDYNFAYRPELIVHSGLSYEEGEESMEAILQNDSQIDGVFAVSDPTAIGAMQALKKLGYKIPQDVSIIGFSNEPATLFVDPPLTTIEQPSYEIGQMIAELCMEAIDNADDEIFTPHVETLKTRLIVRSSTKEKNLF
jgi:LacI family transcriptional regulator